MAESAKNLLNPDNSRSQPRSDSVARWHLRGKPEPLLEICLSGFS